MQPAAYRIQARPRRSRYRSPGWNVLELPIRPLPWHRPLPWRCPDTIAPQFVGIVDELSIMAGTLGFFRPFVEFSERHQRQKQRLSGYRQRENIDSSAQMGNDDAGAEQNTLSAISHALPRDEHYPSLARISPRQHRRARRGSAGARHRAPFGRWHSADRRIVQLPLAHATEDFGDLGRWIRSRSFVL